MCGYQRGREYLPLCKARTQTLWLGIAAMKEKSLGHYKTSIKSWADQASCLHVAQKGDNIPCAFYGLRPYLLPLFLFFNLA